MIVLAPTQARTSYSSQERDKTVGGGEDEGEKAWLCQGRDKWLMVRDALHSTPTVGVVPKDLLRFGPIPFSIHFQSRLWAPIFHPASPVLKLLATRQGIYF